MWNPYNQFAGVPFSGNINPFPNPQNLPYSIPLPTQNPYENELTALKRELDEERTRAVQSNTSFVQKCIKFENEIRNLKSQIQNQKSKSASLESKCQSLERELELAKNVKNNETVSKLEAEVKHWKELYESRNSSYKTVSNTLGLTRHKVKELEEKHYNFETIKGIKDLEISELTKRLNKFEKLKQALETKAQRELSEYELFAEYEKLMSNNDSRLNIISAQEKNIRALKTEIRNLNTKLREKTKVIKQMKKKANTNINQDQIIVNISEDNTNTDRVNNLEHRLKDRDFTVEKLNSIIENMNEKYSLQNNQIYNLKSQNKFYEQKLEKLKEQLKNIQGMLNQSFLVDVDVEEQDISSSSSSFETE